VANCVTAAPGTGDGVITVEGTGDGRSRRESELQREERRARLLRVRTFGGGNSLVRFDEVGAPSSPVAASNTQSCSIPAPSPTGFSRLSFGPVTYPSSELEMSQITSAMSASFLCATNSSHEIYADGALRHLSSASHPSRLAVGPAPASQEEGHPRRCLRRTFTTGPGGRGSVVPLSEGLHESLGTNIHAPSLRAM
jgi:hypothetical protein